MSENNTDNCTESSPMICYSVFAENKNSTYTNEYYSNRICGKRVVLVITTVWRSGEFNITIREDEKEEIQKMSPLIINDHSGEFVSTEDGWQYSTEIQNIDSYTEEEKKAIYESVYENIESETVYDSCILEDENGWELDNTIYEIYDGVELDES